MGDLPLGSQFCPDLTQFKFITGLDGLDFFLLPSPFWTPKSILALSSTFIFFLNLVTSSSKVTKRQPCLNSESFIILVFPKPFFSQKLPLLLCNPDSQVLWCSGLPPGNYFPSLILTQFVFMWDTTEAEGGILFCFFKAPLWNAPKIFDKYDQPC